MFRRALIVANPVAGRGRGECVARELDAGLQRLGIASELYLTGARGDATLRTRALDAATELVVSVGGDGTLREVLEGLEGERVPVAIVPLGTANVLSLDLALPRDVAGALRVIEGGRSTALDVGTVNGELTFLVTGVGLDALVVREVERARHGPITKLAYFSAMSRALRGYRPPALEVELDGARIAGPVQQVLIANIVHYGGHFRLAPDRVLDDGRFEVYLFRDARPLAMARAALRGFFAHLPGGRCEMLRARRVRVGCAEPVAYHVDGDFRGHTPIDFEVAPERRRVLIP